MLERSLVVAGGLIALAAVAAPAQPPATGAEGKPAKEKKICREEASTGSMMTDRTCHTKAEWAEIDRQNQINYSHYNGFGQRALGSGPR